jgi:hypothetical protein
MFDRIARSWQLAKASAAVLSADKELLVFPLLSALASLLVLATFAIPMFLTGLLEHAAAGDPAGRLLGAALALAFYVSQYFVIFFCNSALVGAAMIRLRGGDPTAGDGFRIALSRLGPILGYAALAATVGMLLRALSRRGGPLARFVASLVGLAWSLATYLVVPVLVVEDVGPLEAVKRSAVYLKKTWGEQIAGSVGLGLVFGVAFFALIVAGVAGLMLAAIAGSGALAAIVGVLLLLSLLLLALLSAALEGIYAAAVYRYAAEGKAEGFFPETLVRDAFARS